MAETPPATPPAIPSHAVRLDDPASRDRMADLLEQLAGIVRDDHATGGTITTVRLDDSDVVTCSIVLPRS